MGLVTRLVVPSEGVVGEIDVDPHVVQGLPEVRHLLALADGVSGDQCAPGVLALREPRGLHVPGTAEVDVAGVLRAVEHCKEIGLLLFGLIAGSQERRVSHEVGEVGGEHLGPIGREGISLA